MRARRFAVLSASAALALGACGGTGATGAAETAKAVAVETPSGEGDGTFESSAPTAHEACMTFFRFDYRNDDRDEEVKVVMGSNLRAAELAYESPVESLRETVNADHAELGMYLLDSSEFIEVCEQYGYEAVEGSSAWFVKETAAGRPPRGNSDS